MHTFDGMEIGTVTSWEDSFTEEYNDDGQLTLLSKKAFHHEEPELDFNYRYVITAVDMCRAAGKAALSGSSSISCPSRKTGAGNHF